jgi:hypothetical protein
VNLSCGLLPVNSPVLIQRAPVLYKTPSPCLGFVGKFSRIQLVIDVGVPEPSICNCFPGIVITDTDILVKVLEGQK